MPDFDLRAAAERALVDRGFTPAPSDAARREVAALGPDSIDTLPEGVRDLRALLWSSIDNAESQDLDQVEWAEAAGGAARVLVGIADVDALVPKGSAVDADAAHNATSVYAGAEVFPMLPLALSAGRTSLLEGQDRLAVVVELLVGADGAVARHDVYRALVRNQAKLAYDVVGPWLEGGDVPGSVARVPGLAEQLRLQHDVARRLGNERLRAGALEFETIEARPVTANGAVVGLAVVHKNAARELIENFMIAANIAFARFLEARGSSGIRRVVREPERWTRIVEIAARYGDALPDTPDARALAAFLARRRPAALPRPLALGREAHGPRRVRARPARPRPGRPLRPRRGGLLARHGA